MRGKDAPTLLHHFQYGIIPAHAGKRIAGRRSRPRKEDHPRSCGEKVPHRLRPQPPAGSSPLMRGKAYEGAERSGATGIIPAHAGKRSVYHHALKSTKDHPRSCGEKPIMPVSQPKNEGSSPLMRGKVLLDVHYMGCYEDHPRSCGEKNFLPGVSAARRGSSPLMRGKALAAPARREARRIIPAHAGKRHFQSHPDKEYQDHPRSCGEKANLPGVNGILLGSSPLMRGKDSWLIGIIQLVGIIPAHAGKSHPPRRIP